MSFQVDPDALTAASRRSANVARFLGTKMSQFSSAAIPAAWMAMNCPVSTKLFTLASADAISGRGTAQPQRHPVMLKVFDSE